ncbi:MAG: SPASM domain-containing protein [Nitrospira sp.]|nr:SPASM domain-containing protein [Nitrospira sp.]
MGSHRFVLIALHCAEQQRTEQEKMATPVQMCSFEESAPLWSLNTLSEDPALVYDRSGAVQVFEHLLQVDLIPPGYFRQFAKDNVTWLKGQRLEPCDAGRYSLAIDASGNVAPCLAFPPVGNLRESSYREILSRLDRDRVQACSDCSSCNRLDGRVVGSILRHPVTAWRTPVSFQ